MANYILEFLFMHNAKENSIPVSMWLPWHMPVAWGSSHRWAGILLHLSRLCDNGGCDSLF